MDKKREKLILFIFCCFVFVTLFVLFVFYSSGLLFDTDEWGILTLQGIIVFFKKEKM